MTTNPTAADIAAANQAAALSLAAVLDDDATNLGATLAAVLDTDTDDVEPAERITLESCICGECTYCPDGYHGTDENCICTADCALCPTCNMGAVGACECTEYEADTITVYMPVAVTVDPLDIVSAATVDTDGAPWPGSAGVSNAVWNATSETWQTNNIDGPHAERVATALDYVGRAFTIAAAVDQLRAELNAIGSRGDGLPGADVVDLIAAMFAQIGEPLPAYDTPAVDLDDPTADHADDLARALDTLSRPELNGRTGSRCDCRYGIHTPGPCPDGMDVERCDECETFPDDIAAARALAAAYTTVTDGEPAWIGWQAAPGSSADDPQVIEAGSVYVTTDPAQAGPQYVTDAD